MVSVGCVFQSFVPPRKCIENCKLPERFRKPSKNYLIGVSKLYREEQDAINDAMIHARKQIVDQLSIHVSRELLGKLITKGKTSDILTTDISDVALTKIVANNILVGTRMNERWTQKWVRAGEHELKYYYKVYLLMQFSESDNNRFMQAMFKETLKNAKNRYKDAKKEEGNGNIKKALFYYRELLEITEKLEDIIPPEEVISVKEEIVRIRSDANVSIKSIREGISLARLNEEIIVRVRESSLPSMIQLQATYQGTPIIDLPIIFSFSTGSGVLDERAITNMYGIASCKINRYKIPIGECIAIIRAQTEIKEGRDSDWDGVPTIEFVINYIPNAVVVRISAENGISSATSVEQKIGQTLKNQGFKVVAHSDADLIAEGNIEVIESKFITQFGETLAYAKLSLSLTVSDIKRSDIILSKMATKEGWDDDSVKSAQENAINEIITAIPDMLSDLRDNDTFLLDK